VRQQAFDGDGDASVVPVEHVEPIGQLGGQMVRDRIRQRESVACGEPQDEGGGVHLGQAREVERRTGSDRCGHLICACGGRLPAQRSVGGLDADDQVTAPVTTPDGTIGEPPELLDHTLRRAGTARTGAGVHVSPP